MLCKVRAECVHGKNKTTTRAVLSEFFKQIKRRRFLHPLSSALVPISARQACFRHLFTAGVCCFTLCLSTSIIIIIPALLPLPLLFRQSINPAISAVSSALFDPSQIVYVQQQVVAFQLGPPPPRQLAGALHLCTLVLEPPRLSRLLGSFVDCNADSFRRQFQSADIP